MAWALAVILVIGVGLPVGAWRLGRHLESRRQPIGELGPPADQVDKWLIEQHRLPAVQRWQVRDAVLHGRALRDPALRHAAHDLAAGALRGELKMGRSIRIAGCGMLAEGIGMIAAGIFVWVRVGSPATVVLFLLGAWWLVIGAIALRTIGRGPRRAYHLNSDSLLSRCRTERCPMRALVPCRRLARQRGRRVPARPQGASGPVRPRSVGSPAEPDEQREAISRASDC